MALRYRLEQLQVIARPRAEVFAFFSDAANLERLTPEFLNFKIVTPRPIEMRTGAIIDYRLRLYGFPVGWRTEIQAFEPDDRFIDFQTEGPYRYWRHEHLFRDVAEGTEMRDVVDYELPLGPLGRVAHAALVRRSVSDIFSYRRRAVASIFG